MFGIPPEFFVVLVVASIFFVWTKILGKDERALIFRLGQLLPYLKGPGLIVVLWPMDRMVKIDLQTRRGQLIIELFNGNRWEELRNIVELEG